MIPNDKEQEETLETLLNIFNFSDETKNALINPPNPFQSIFRIIWFLGISLVLLNTQITLLILKLSEVVDWSWITTLSPVLSMALVGLIGFFFFRSQIKNQLNF